MGTEGWLVVGGVLLALGIWLGLGLARAAARRRMGRSRTMGRRGEEIAFRLLKRAGFQILEEQPSAQTYVSVDGQRHAFTLRGDALVSKQGRCFLVEIKSTSHSADLKHRDTRRQLLEYATAFDVEACLLVNAERETIQVVTFPALEETPL